MALQFNCPACGRSVSAPDTARGVTGPCPHCRAQITAPAGLGQPARLGQPPTGGAVPPAAPGYAPPAYPSGQPLAGPPTLPGYGAVPGYDDAYPAAGYDDHAVAPGGALSLGAILSEAWQVVMGNAGLVIGGFLLIWAIQMVVMAPILTAGFLTALKEGMAGGFNPAHPPQLPLRTQMLISAVSLLFAPLGFGPLFIIDQLLAQGHSSIGALFMATALSLTFMEIVDRGAGAIEALQASWEATAGQRLALFGNLLVLWLVGVAGYLLCGIGALVTLPVAWAGYAIIYREMRGLKGATG